MFCFAGRNPSLLLARFLSFFRWKIQPALIAAFLVVVLVFVGFQQNGALLGNAWRVWQSEVLPLEVCFKRPGGSWLYSREGDSPVPCVPLHINYGNYSGVSAGTEGQLDGLLLVEQRSLGLYALFQTSTVGPPSRKRKQAHSHYARAHGGGFREEQKGRTLRVAVQVAGHLRTFRKCAPSLRHHVLEMNAAQMFLVTYMMIGDKYYSSADINDVILDHAAMQDLIYHYRPFLAGLYMLDAPSVENYITSLHSPSIRGIYQFFIMQLANDLVAASVNRLVPDWNASDNLFLLFPGERTLYAKGGDHGERGGVAYEPFDVVIRVRPDLFIMGPLWVEPLLTAEQQRRAVVEWRRVAPESRMVGERDILRKSFVVYFLCGSESYPPLIVPPFHVVFAPHHPTIYVKRVGLSDFSAIVGMDDEDRGDGVAPGAVFRVFHDILNHRFNSMCRRGKRISKCFAEAAWRNHVQQHRHHILPFFGWHVLLRNADVYYARVGGTAQMQYLPFASVNGVVDHTRVLCPHVNLSTFY